MSSSAPPISFGIEFEFDVVSRDGQRVYYNSDRRYYTVEGWDYQRDLTATVELRSPVFTNVVEAVRSIREEFKTWAQKNEGVAPYAFSEPSRSLGQHVHVGVPHRSLSREEKKAIAKRVAIVYPFLTGLHAQPIPSHRGLTSHYCYPIWQEDYRIPALDHYCEISDSHVGTVEFRAFDSNVPQVTLTCVTILQRVAEVALREGSIDFDEEFKRRYRNDRTNVLRRGLVAINVCDYMKEVEKQVGDFELPDVNCVKELLYLACKYRLNAYNVYTLLSPSKFEYFFRMFTNPSEYLQNLIDLATNRMKARVQRWIEEAQRVERLSDLMRLAEETQTILSRVTHVATQALPRSKVREAIEQGNYYVARIQNVRGYTDLEVAQRIEELLRNHGEGLVDVMTAEEIIESQSRFFVFVVPRDGNDRDLIVGAVAVRASTGEIHSLVIDRRYRRLGIARKLVDHALSVLEREGQRKAHAFVRLQNVASRQLLESMGFRFVRMSVNGRSKLFARRV